MNDEWGPERGMTNAERRTDRAERVAIIGLGLMGGSLGLALKALASGPAVRAYARRRVTRDLALARGVCDEVFETPAEAAEGADLVVICVPILTIPELAAACAPVMAPGGIITDVGSTKVHICREAAARIHNSEVAFIGSHPIAGSEQQGLEAATANLYNNAFVVLTPEQDAHGKQINRLSALWSAAGARVCVMSPAAHDKALAGTSHLPHIVAALTAVVVGRPRDALENVGLLCGTGFADTTRIAAGGPEIWSDIVQTNQAPIQAELAMLQQELAVFQRLLGDGDIEGIRAFFEKARTCRRQLMETPSCADEDKRHG